MGQMGSVPAKLSRYSYKLGVWLFLFIAKLYVSFYCVYISYVRIFTFVQILPAVRSQSYSGL